MISPRAFNIARYNSIQDIDQYIHYVQGSEDPDVRGLVAIMAEEIALARLSKEGYMGGTSTRIEDCEDDARVLLARFFSDTFQQAEVLDRLRERLGNITTDIKEKTGIDDENRKWLMAERRFIRSGLKHLEYLINSY